MIPRILLIAMIATQLPLASLSAQDAPRSGDVIRARVDGRRVQGRLLEAPRPGEPFRLEQPGSRAHLELARTTPGLERRVRPSRKVHGMLTGLGIGAATGAAIGLVSGDDKGGFLAFSAEEKAAGFGTFLGAVGGVVGAVVSQGAVWEPLDSPREPPRLGLRITSRGAGIRIAF